MININKFAINSEEVIKKVCDFLNIEKTTNNENVEEAIKELCVKRLCKTIGLTGKYNYKSDFFEFFSCVVGEAICDMLSIRIHLACDELRFVKYEHINLVHQVKNYLTHETIEEAFLDSFELIDKFKFLIKNIKKN